MFTLFGLLDFHRVCRMHLSSGVETVKNFVRDCTVKVPEESEDHTLESDAKEVPLSCRPLIRSWNSSISSSFSAKRKKRLHDIVEESQIALTLALGLPAIRKRLGKACLKGWAEHQGSLQNMISWTLPSLKDTRWLNELKVFDILILELQRLGPNSRSVPLGGVGSIDASHYLMYPWRTTRNAKKNSIV